MKYSGYEENELYSIVNPICEGYKTKIVQLNSGIVNSTLQIRIVLYKKGGINIDSCTEISRAVMPRIEVWADNRDVNLEVSSPGVSRVLKDAYEFHIFTDERVNVLIGNDWIGGVVSEANETSVYIRSENVNTEYKYDKILKAKLD